MLTTSARTLFVQCAELAVGWYGRSFVVVVVGLRPMEGCTV